MRFVAIETRNSTIFGEAFSEYAVTAVRAMIEKLVPLKSSQGLCINRVPKFGKTDRSVVLDVYKIPGHLQDVYRGRCDDDIMMSIKNSDGEFIEPVECVLDESYGSALGDLMREFEGED